MVNKELYNKFDWSLILLILSFSVESVLRYFSEFLSRIPIIMTISEYFVPFLFCIVIIISLKEIVSKVKIFDFVFVLIIACLLLVSYFKKENQIYITSNLKDIFLVFIPFYFLGLSMKTTEKTFRWLYLISLIALFINWGYLFYYYSTGRSFSIDSMYESYTMLIHVLIILWVTLRNPSILRIFFSVSGFLYILSMGTRGPVVIIIAFIILYYLLGEKINIKMKALFFILLMTLGILFLYTNSINYFVLQLRGVIANFGLSTRIFDSYLYGAAQDSIVQRDNIYNVLIVNLKNSPWFGFGMYGEYPFIEWSAHNMYLQVFFEFGFLVGTPLLISFIGLSINAIKNNNSSLERGFALLLIAYIYVQGFFGGNILSYYVFFTIGYFVNLRRSNLVKIRDGSVHLGGSK